MQEITLVLKKKLKVPLEADVISPNIFSEKKISEIAGLAAWHGNRRTNLGDFFEIEGETFTEPENLHVIIKGDASKVKWVGKRMTSGKITISGNIGMHVGAEMYGGEIIVEGDAESWAGTELRGGLLHIKGNAGDYVGAVYRGEWRGMKKGLIIVEGNVGNELALWMRGGRITVKGNAGSFAGAHLSGGTVMIHGDINGFLGAEMKKGTIAAFSKLEGLLPGFKFNEEVPILKLDEEEIEGPFLKFVGDLAESGKGELYVLKEKNLHLV
ncbi:MAG: formylmethanofuran dehydrogenase subunit C [Candidatus Hodarchaeota archaeon]